MAASMRGLAPICACGSRGCHADLWFSILEVHKTGIQGPLSKLDTINELAKSKHMVDSGPARSETSQGRFAEAMFQSGQPQHLRRQHSKPASVLEVIQVGPR